MTEQRIKITILTTNLHSGQSTSETALLLLLHNRDELLAVKIWFIRCEEYPKQAYFPTVE
jgi:hypothetical protein